VYDRLHSASFIDLRAFDRLSAVYDELLLPLYRVQSCFKSNLLGTAFWEVLEARRERNFAKDGVSVTAEDLMVKYAGQQERQSGAPAALRRRHTISNIGEASNIRANVQAAIIGADATPAEYGFQRRGSDVKKVVDQYENITKDKVRSKCLILTLTRRYVDIW
jgi:hypothetical protein